MNDAYDNAKTDKQQLAKLVAHVKRQRVLPNRYTLDTSSEHFEGSASHILGIATYLKTEPETSFKIREIHIREITFRTLKSRVDI